MQSLTGRVVHGDHVGKVLGYPTANLDCDIPSELGNGVYAVTVEIAGTPHDGVAVIRTRSKTTGRPRQAEVHIFDFDTEIYGNMITVMFLAFIRQFFAFPSREALIMQIEEDCMNARQILKDVHGNNNA